MNRLLIRLLVLVLALVVATPASASTPGAPRFFRDGIPCSGVESITFTERLYVRLIDVRDCLGVMTSWDEKTQQARIWGQVTSTKYADIRMWPTWSIPYFDAYNSDGSMIGSFHIGEQWPLIIRGRTFVPFRALIESFGVRVDWIAPEANPRGFYGEVHISTDLWPRVTDSAAMQPYIIHQNGQLALTEPQFSWPVAPPTYFSVVRALEAANAGIDYYNGRGRPYSYQWDIALGPRVQFQAGGKRVDWYGTHAVLWMRSEAQTMEYIDGLTSDGMYSRFIGAVAGAGAAWATEALLAPTPWSVPILVGYAAGEVKAQVDKRWTDAHQDCLDLARDLDTWRPDSPPGQGILGFVYGEGRVYCVPAFTNQEISPKGEVL